MQALLQFIMRGRLQAITAAMIGSWFPLVSPAVVALVGLRKGAFEGTLVMVGAMLPALFALVLDSQGVSDIGPAMVFITLLSLVVVMLTAQLLRVTVSWSRSLTGLVALSAASALVLGWFLPDPVQAMTDALGDFMQQLVANAPEGAVAASPGSTFVLGLIAFVIGLSSLASLLLARWWQARLYNPGGFQREFHALRLTPVQTLVCAAAAIYCELQSFDYQSWASLFALPLLIAGIALIHALVKARGSRTGWLVAMYVLLTLWAPFAALLAAIGTADTWLNLRGRLQASAPPSD